MSNMPSDTARISKTQIKPYDQVIALTQWLLNKGIEELYAWVNDNHPDRLSADVTRRDGSGIFDLRLGAPQIIIDAQPGNLSQVLYRMHLKSGQLRMFASENPRVKQEVHYEIHDWYFTFPVNVGLVGVDPKSALYAELRAKMNKPGDYSISQLLVDMSTAQFGIPNQTYCSYGNWSETDNYVDVVRGKQTFTRPPLFDLGRPRDWSKEDKFVQAQLGRFFQDCTELLMDAGFNDLGAVATADQQLLDAEHPPHPPTFLPTDVRFQTYPWTDPWDASFHPTTGLDGLSRLNYLCYLEMTEGAPPPLITSPGAWLDVTKGNWTDGRDPSTEAPSKFGSFVLSGDKFLEKFFLPKLQPLNRLLTCDIKKPTVSVNAHFLSVGWSITASMTVGGEGKDEHFAFRRQSSGASSTSTKESLLAFFPGGSTSTAEQILDSLDTSSMAQLPANAVQWVYTYMDDPARVHAEDKSQIHYNAYIWGGSTTSTIVRVSIIPGTNYLTLEGRSSTKVDMKIDPNWADSDVYLFVQGKASWKVVFTLRECIDGGLLVDVEADYPKVSFSSNDSDGAFSKGIQEYMQKAYKTAGSNFASYTSELKNALAGQEKFYFPSKGVFLFKNPLFDHNANLVCEIAYSPHEKNESPNQGADAKPRDFSVPEECQPMPGEYTALADGVCTKPTAHS